MRAPSPAPAANDGARRPIVLVSLALNVFFIGLLGALALGQYMSHARDGGTDPSRYAAARIERLAALLATADAEQLRAQFHLQEGAIETAWAAYRDARASIGGALRTEPFGVDQLRAAMTRTRAARQAFEQLLQDVVATAAVKMSPEGRHRLADGTVAGSGRK